MYVVVHLNAPIRLSTVPTVPSAFPSYISAADSLLQQHCQEYNPIPKGNVHVTQNLELEEYPVFEKRNRCFPKLQPTHHTCTILFVTIPHLLWSVTCMAGNECQQTQYTAHDVTVQSLISYLLSLPFQFVPASWMCFGGCRCLLHRYRYF